MPSRFVNESSASQSINSITPRHSTIKTALANPPTTLFLFALIYAGPGSVNRWMRRRSRLDGRPGFLWLESPASRLARRSFFQIRRGRFVLGEVGHELGPDTPPGEANDLERARDRALANADCVAHTKRLGGFGLGVVEANLAAAAGFRRLATRLEQAHGEQPFVHPHFLRLVHFGSGNRLAEGVRGCPSRRLERRPCRPGRRG